MPDDGNRITVGVPVYRSWDVVADTLRSIQNQTHKNFEVIISVDGNDDRSAEVCRPFLADTRFQMVIQSGQLGWVGNINWLLSQSMRDFFCYYQHDDYTDPSYFEILIAEASKFPQAAAVYSDVQCVGGRSDIVSEPSIRGDPTSRVIAQIDQFHWAAFNGIVRHEALRQAGLFRITPFDSYSEDIVWVTRLARWGDLIQVPRAIYFKRFRTENVTNKWYRWEEAKRREAWISLLVGVLEAAIPVASTNMEREVILNAVLDRLAPLDSEKFALYRLLNVAEYRKLILDFFAHADSLGVCALRPKLEKMEMLVVYGLL